MKERTKLEAQATLVKLAVWPNCPDFHTLSSSQVDEVIEAANAARYRKPAHANGSRARYFYERLLRRAGK